MTWYDLLKDSYGIVDIVIVPSKWKSSRWVFNNHYDGMTLTFYSIAAVYRYFDAEVECPYSIRVKLAYENLGA